jgi:hypothetical protein
MLLIYHLKPENQVFELKKVLKITGFGKGGIKMAVEFFFIHRHSKIFFGKNF